MGQAGSLTHIGQPVPVARATHSGFGVRVEISARHWGWHRQVRDAENAAAIGPLRFGFHPGNRVGQNQAVAENEYLLGWSRNPVDVKSTQSPDSPEPDRSRILLWHANYHPDGGQLFFPFNGEAFVCPLALLTMISSELPPAAP